MIVNCGEQHGHQRVNGESCRFRFLNFAPLAKLTNSAELKQHLSADAGTVAVEAVRDAS